MTARSIPEWVGSSPDAAIPQRVQLRIFELACGRCPECTSQLRPGKWHVDHITALINGGEHRESNLQAICYWCHAEKTKADVAEKAKVYAVRAKHLGIHKSKRPFRGWQKFDRTAVRNPKLRARP